MKRIFVQIIAFVVAMSCCFANLVFAADEKTNTAEAILGSSVTQSGFDLIETGTSTTPTIVVRAGSESWMMDKGAGTAQSYIGFSLDEQFTGKAFDGSVYTISVEYYDNGAGFFNLIYDSVSKPKQRAGYVYMQSEGRWKTHCFTLDDAEFKNEVLGKYDFILSLTETGTGVAKSSSSVPIRKVTVERRNGVNPIWVSSKTDRTGNAFEWFSDSKIIHNTYQNLTAEQKNIIITHKLISNEGYVAFEKSEEMTFDPEESKELDFNFSEFERCDVYNYFIIIKDKNNTFNSKLNTMELAILKTDPNGIKDDRIFWNAHFTHTTDVAAHKAMWDILALSNAGGVRESVAWSYLEPTRGDVKVDSTTQMFLDGLKNSGMKSQIILQTMPTFYSGVNALPKGEEELAAWRNYLTVAVNAVKDLTNMYEVWNEPNIKHFNMLMDDRRGDVYMKAFDVAYEVIKEIDPDAKVSGPSVGGNQFTLGRSYWSETIQNGLWKNAEAIAIHPYATTTYESSNQVEILKDYRKEFMDAGGKEPEMWQTELGYTKADNYVVTSRMQGALDSRMVISLISHGLGDEIALYNLEEKGTIETNREHMFGVVSPKSASMTKFDGRCIPGEAFVELVATSYMLADAEIESIYDTADKNLYISKFKSNKFGTDVLTFYADKEPKTITVDLDAEKLTLFDEYGNETEIYGNNGVFTLTVDHYPKYLLGDIPKFEITDSKKFIEYSDATLTAAATDVFPIHIYNYTGKDYSVEVDTPQSIRVVENNGFENNVAIVKLENMCDVGEEAFVVITVKDGDKIVQESKMGISSVDILDADLSVYLEDPKNPSVWTGIINIKNNAESKALTGYANFETPDLFKGIKNVNIGIIPPGKTGEIKFTIPKVNKKGQYFPQYNISLYDGKYFSFADSAEFTLAKYAEKKPVIDGIITDDEWPMEMALYADSVEQIRQITDWGGVKDLSGKSVVLWDEENFYMCAIVTDDKHVNTRPESENWNGDNMQFGIFYGNQDYVAMGQGGTSFHEISIALNSLTDKVTTYRYSAQDDSQPTGPLSEAECKITRKDNQTYYEFKMPWNSLLRPGDMPKEGEMLGYSFLFNEADSELRDGWIEYASGIGESKNTALFTYMQLIR